MPLHLAEGSQELCVSRITESDAVKRHLADTGFVTRQTTMVVTAIDDNIIVKVTVTKIAPLSDPIEIELRGYSLSIRKTTLKRSRYRR